MSIRRVLIAAALCGAGFVPLVAQEDLPSLLKAGADLEQRREWIKATEVYTKATVAYPSQSAGFERLGDLYRKNGAFARAVENYRKALQLSPDDEQLRSLLRLSEQAAKEQADGVVQATTFRDLASAVRTVKPQTVKTAGTDPESIPVHINFPRNKYRIGDLDATARRQLDEVATLLSSPEWRDRRPVVVEGHTCSCGSNVANLVLGRKRGEAVLEYLIAKNALRAGEGSVISMGKSNPLVASDKENLGAEACARDEAHNQNRRVIIREAHASVAPLVTFWYKPVGSETLRPLTDGSVLYRKDEIRVKIQAANPMFAYVVHHGPDDAWEVVYPRQGASEAAMLSADARGDGHWIPGQESGFSVRGKSGNEEALVYLSPTPIPEFEAQPKPPIVGPDGGTPRIEGGTSVPRTTTTTTTTTTKPRVLIKDEVRSLAVAGAIRLPGPPRGALPTATVKFKSHD